jgi:hypothetical protein
MSNAYLVEQKFPERENLEFKGPFKMTFDVKSLHDEATEYEKMKVGMLERKHCYLIVHTHSVWLSYLEEEMRRTNPSYIIPQLIKDVWATTEKVWSLFHCTEEQVIEKQKAGWVSVFAFLN